MIICLIIIIIILLLILCIWWVFRNNNYNNKNSFKSMNSHLQHMPMQQAPPMQPDPSTLAQVPIPTKYVGNIDDSIEEINNSILNNTLETNNALMNGHRDLQKNDNSNAPVGNITNVMDTNAPYAAPIPIYQEKNIHSIDYDEANSFQGLARNDPLRPTVGIIARGSMMDGFLREELEDAEDKEWWGNGDW